nr:immunoglobulin light chain junction region [Macaca mulatta]MOX13555.1 immunoglobulin light chain junction region [Macaca mulatta]
DYYCQFFDGGNYLLF